MGGYGTNFFPSNDKETSVEYHFNPEPCFNEPDSSSIFQDGKLGALFSKSSFRGRALDREVAIGA